MVFKELHIASHTLQVSIDTRVPSFGVKGPTPLSEIIDVPILPLDPLHLVFGQRPLHYTTFKRKVRMIPRITPKN